MRNHTDLPRSWTCTPHSPERLSTTKLSAGQLNTDADRVLAVSERIADQLGQQQDRGRRPVAKVRRVDQVARRHPDVDEILEPHPRDRRPDGTDRQGALRCGLSADSDPRREHSRVVIGVAFISASANVSEDHDLTSEDGGNSRKKD
jgi:hypothetical protein